MVKPTYDDAPAAPSIGDSPSTFQTLADAFVAWIPGFKTFVDSANTHIDTQLSATETARDKANEWAEKAEDSAVETGQFSALHHAAKAAASASASASSASAASTSESNAEGFKDTAETAAAAAQAAAGLPSLTGNAGKALKVNEAEDGVLFGIAGALIPLSKHEVTSAVAAVEFTIPSGYSMIKLVIQDLKAVSDAVQLLVRTSSDGGSTWISDSNYQYGSFGNRPDSGNTAVVASTGEEAAYPSDSWGLIVDLENNIPGEGWSGEMAVMNLVSSLQTKMHFTGQAEGSLNYFVCFGAGRRNATELTDALQFRFSSGNIASGTIHVYGVAEAA